MIALIAGLWLFLSIHSVRMLAPDSRDGYIERFGVKGWKLIHTWIAIVGLALIVIGYGMAREAPIVLYTPPIWTRHIAALLTLPAFVLIVAAYIPGTHMRARIGHPMVAGMKLWALAHLLANGTLADVLLFGSFLVWAVANFSISRRRDRKAGVPPAEARIVRDLIALAVGAGFWVVFALHLHAMLIGVRPF